MNILEIVFFNWNKSTIWLVFELMFLFLGFFIRYLNKEFADLCEGWIKICDSLLNLEYNSNHCFNECSQICSPSDEKLIAEYKKFK
jgi:hypothetical protein